MSSIIILYVVFIAVMVLAGVCCGLAERRRKRVERAHIHVTAERMPRKGDGRR